MKQVSLAIALALTLAACDSNQIEKDNATANAVAASTELGSEVAYKTTDSPARTRQFKDEQAFIEATDELLSHAETTGQPILIQSSLEWLVPFETFAPLSELAMLDQNGRVVIGENTVEVARTATGAKTIWRNAAGDVVEEVTSEESEQTKVVNPADEDAVGCVPLGPYTTKGGSTIYVRALGTHNAYKSGFSKRANAMTELIYSTVNFSLGDRPCANTNGFYDLPASLIANGGGMSVRAEVYVINGNNCADYGATFAASAGLNASASKIHVKAGGSRSAQYVSESYHQYNLYGTIPGPGFYVDGAGSNDCGA